jgi:hypothetical protein
MKSAIRAGLIRENVKNSRRGMVEDTENGGSGLGAGTTRTEGEKKVQAGR